MRLHLFITILMLVVLAMTVTNCLTLQTALELQIDSFTQEMQGQALVLTRQLSGSGYFEHSDDPTVNAVIEQTADMWGGRIQVIIFPWLCCFSLASVCRILFPGKAGRRIWQLQL